MKDKMLVSLLIVISIIKRQANAQTTVVPSDQGTTMQLEHETPSWPIVSTYVVIIKPTTDATSAGRPTQTTSGSTTAAMETDIPNVEPQTDEMASSTIDTTYAVLKRIGFTTQSTSSSTTNIATVTASSEIPITAAQNTETVSSTGDTTQAASFSSSIISTTSLFESTVQTSSGQTQTDNSVFTESTSSRLSPTAKLSVTTENAMDSETTKLGKTTDYKTQTSTKIPTDVQKTSREAVKTSTASEPTAETEIETTYVETPKNGVNHGRIAAWIIGGALIAMLIGFLVIWYKKQKLKKHQIATTDWAGPTPFLETGEVNNGIVRGASRISLASFLPQRLSKRLSLLAEEMPDMNELMTPSTFGVKEEKKVEKNGVQVDKVEKNYAKVDGNLNNSNEAVENKSESLNKTEPVVVVDELKPNGEVKSKDNIVPEKTTNDIKEDEKIQPLSAENPHKEEKVN
ncbi:unnamed protein product [Knipowitschia caucasica]